MGLKFFVLQSMQVRQKIRYNYLLLQISYKLSSKNAKKLINKRQKKNNQRHKTVRNPVPKR